MEACTQKVDLNHSINSCLSQSYECVFSGCFLSLLNLVRKPLARYVCYSMEISINWVCSMRAKMEISSKSASGSLSVVAVFGFPLKLMNIFAVSWNHVISGTTSCVSRTIIFRVF